MATVRRNPGGGLLGGDEVDYHVDDAGAAGAAAEVHAGAPDFVLQQLVQLPAQHFHQLGHLEKPKKKKHLFTLDLQLYRLLFLLL